MSFPKNLLVVYGTATGTAREVALRIAREAYSFCIGQSPEEYHCFRPEVKSIKEVTTDYLLSSWTKSENKRVVFIVSTTGQGEFPEDCVKLWREFMRKNTPDLPIEYVVIGLGDSSYEKYNFAGKKLHKRLELMKASPVFEVCLCDDQHDLGYVGALNPFLEKCWGLWVPEEFRSARNAKPRARFSLSEKERSGMSGDAQQTDRRIEKRRMIRNERLTANDHFQDTRLIAFDTVDSELTFVEGDAIQVYPENFPENVELFFEIFPHLKDQPPFYVNCDPGMSWESIPLELLYVLGPQPWTWEQVATQLLDLKSIPGVCVFEILQSFTEDPLLKEKFNELCGAEGLEDLYNYINRPRRTILEVFQDFPAVVSQIPTNYIFDLVPFMRPRAFSIASPPKEKHHIEILVAVVEYKTNLKKPRMGTCSYWLAHHCHIDQPVAIYCEKGSLRPPRFSESTVIMVGPGTGVAPFRSMIKQHLDSPEMNKFLVFGCRNKGKDYYFGEEFESYSNSGKLKFYTAFSRDNLGQKVDYVQDLILRNTEEIKLMLDGEAPLYIYVCGRSGDMPKAVFNAFKVAFKKYMKNPDTLLDKMLDTGYYQTETY